MTGIRSILIGISFIGILHVGSSQSNPYDLGLRIDFVNSYFNSNNTSENNFSNTTSEFAVKLGINNIINFGKGISINVGVSYMEVYSQKYSDVAFLSFPFKVQKYFNTQQDGLNLSWILDPGMDLFDENELKLDIGYDIGYRLKKVGNFGLNFQMDLASVERRRLMYISVFYSYYVF